MTDYESHDSTGAVRSGPSYKSLHGKDPPKLCPNCGSKMEEGRWSDCDYDIFYCEKCDHEEKVEKYG